MERIKLSKNEKKVLLLVSSGQDCPDSFPAHVFAGCVRTLEIKGLIKGAYVEGGGVEAARLTSYGRTFLAENPKLRNPLDWKWIITTAIAVAGLITAIVFGCIACSKL